MAPDIDMGRAVIRHLSITQRWPARRKRKECRRIRLMMDETKPSKEPVGVQNIPYWGNRLPMGRRMCVSVGRGTAMRSFLDLSCSP